MIEIASPTAARHDLELRRSLYQACGVREYRVMLSNDDVVDKYLLEGGAYKLIGRCRDRIEFSGFPGAVLDLTKVWGAAAGRRLENAVG